MAKFADKDGREWNVVFDYGAIKRVRASDVEFDLATILADEMAGLRRISDDPVLFIEVLAVMCGDQRPDVSGDEFGAAFNGDALESAQRAFMDALLDFCPSQQRAMLKKLLAMSNDLQQKYSTIVQMASIQDLTSGELASKLAALSDGATGNSTASENSTGRRRRDAAGTGTVRVKSPTSLPR